MRQAIAGTMAAVGANIPAVSTLSRIFKDMIKVTAVTVILVALICLVLSAPPYYELKLTARDSGRVDALSEEIHP